MIINPIGNILEQIAIKDNYNCLCAITHERIESNICRTGHNFYGMQKPGLFKEKWNTAFAPIPNNYHLLNPKLGEEQIPPYIKFDICLSQNKFGQFQNIAPIAQVNKIPLISLEHTASMAWWNQQQKQQLCEMRGIANVFITEWSLESWGWQDRGDTFIIRHAVDTSLFKSNDSIERQNYILEVANDYIGRDAVLNFSQFKRVIIDNNLPFRAVGDTKGFSQAPNNVEELIKEYQNARIFVNTHHISPIPTSLLEAAACGCACVSCNSCGVPEFFEHNKNALLYNNDDEMKKYLELLLNDEAMAKELGNNACQMVTEKCNLNRFCEQWNQIFDFARSMS